MSSGVAQRMPPGSSEIISIPDPPSNNAGTTGTPKQAPTATPKITLNTTPKQAPIATHKQVAPAAPKPAPTTATAVPEARRNLSPEPHIFDEEAIQQDEANLEGLEDEPGELTDENDSVYDPSNADTLPHQFHARRKAMKSSTGTRKGVIYRAKIPKELLRLIDSYRNAQAFKLSVNPAAHPGPDFLRAMASCADDLDENIKDLKEVQKLLEDQAKMSNKISEAQRKLKRHSSKWSLMKKPAN